MSITYTFRESGITVPDLKSSTNTDVEIDVFEYLVPGLNTIDIECKGVTTGAEGKDTVQINVLQLNIDTSFDYTVL